MPNQIFTELIQDKNIPVLDLQPHFVQHLQAKDEKLFWDVDSHWNVAGNRLVGEIVADWLVEQNLVPVAQSE